MKKEDASLTEEARELWKGEFMAGSSKEFPLHEDRWGSNPALE